MNNLKVGNLSLFLVCLVALGPVTASAQSVKHDHMDVAAAKRDLHRLEMDRARAVRYHNLSKIAQDDRLIESDRFWIRRDRHRIDHSGG